MSSSHSSTLTTFVSRLLSRSQDHTRLAPPADPPPQQPDPFLVLLPLLIVLSTFLFLLLVFLVCVLIIRRRRGISLQDHVGPVDMSREELIEGEGGFEGVESRWMESVSDNVRREYIRARDHQIQYPPNSTPTDITLSQFLSIQEKGVSAWSFEPDYETVDSLLVHARTEITFLPDPASSSCVQSNLPLPKLNEVYYWEVKMFDLPETTIVSVGLATKPYPAFRLPGLNRFSVAYHSNGDKSHNYPFTTTPFGPVVKEGDVIGIGYRPRTGTVFFTRNGRKMEDAFIGLSRWNLFPTIGADGPCSVHVNLGQAGFVFIEANVKKWGLAPSVGTLAPPPAYGSERGSILLDVGGRRSRAGGQDSSQSLSPNSRSHRSRRPRTNGSSPLRSTYLSAPSPLTPPPPITPIDEEEEEGTEHREHVGPSRISRFFGVGSSRAPEGYQRLSVQPGSPHSHGHGSMNMRALVLHVMGDALGNVGVIATGLVIWLTDWSFKFYFDPIISLVITIIIFSSALPLVRSASFILLQGVPPNVSLDNLRSAILSVRGVLSLHELHVWQLSESKLVASVHVLASRDCDFMPVAAKIREIFHQNGIHSSTIQPEYECEPGMIPMTSANGGEASCLILCPSDQACDPTENACCPPPPTEV